MGDEDMKIYIPSAGEAKSPAPETDEVKIYTCSSEQPSSDALHSEHVP